MNGCLFEGRPLTVRLPDEPLALPVQQAQQGPLEFKAYVNGLPPSMDEASAAAFFRSGPGGEGFADHCATISSSRVGLLCSGLGRTHVCWPRRLHCRRKYPSVLGVRLWPPARDQPVPSAQRGLVVIKEEGERDAAIREASGVHLLRSAVPCPHLCTTAGRLALPLCLA